MGYAPWNNWARLMLIPRADAIVSTTETTSPAMSTTANYAPCLASPAQLDAAEREDVIRAWGVDMRRALRNASTFARLSMQLLSAGAPRTLVAQAHRAAITEVTRSHRIDSLIADYLGVPQSAPPSPFNRSVAPPASPADVAVDAASLLAAFDASASRSRSRLARAENIRVADVLRQGLDDDLRQADLALRVLNWATAETAPLSAAS